MYPIYKYLVGWYLVEYRAFERLCIRSGPASCSQANCSSGKNFNFFLKVCKIENINQSISPQFYPVAYTFQIKHC